MASIALVFVLAMLVLGTLFLFPVVGLALIPLAVLALVAVLGWGYLVARRSPEALPENRPPGEDL